MCFCITELVAIGKNLIKSSKALHKTVPKESFDEVDNKHVNLSLDIVN